MPLCTHATLYKDIMLFSQLLYYIGESNVHNKHEVAGHKNSIWRACVSTISQILTFTRALATSVSIQKTG